MSEIYVVAVKQKSGLPEIEKVYQYQFFLTQEAAESCLESLGTKVRESFGVYLVNLEKFIEQMKKGVKQGGRRGTKASDLDAIARALEPRLNASLYYCRYCEEPYYSDGRPNCLKSCMVPRAKKAFERIQDAFRQRGWDVPCQRCDGRWSEHPCLPGPHDFIGS